MRKTATALTILLNKNGTEFQDAASYTSNGIGRNIITEIEVAKLIASRNSIRSDSVVQPGPL